MSPRGRAWANHRACPGGCGELEDECGCRRLRRTVPVRAGDAVVFYPPGGEPLPPWHEFERAHPKQNPLCRRCGLRRYDEKARHTA